MMMIITLILIIFSILLIISRLIHKLWWKPLQIQKFLRSQGIKGPSYKFFHGNTKEIIKMRREAFSSCDEHCSHDVFPRILPHLNAWIKLYGNNFLMWIGDRPQIIVTEPELAREILTNREGVYQILARGYWEMGLLLHLQMMMAQGFYIYSSEDGNSQTMAFAGGGYADSLSFFGVHRTAVAESHLAIMGGTGKYVNAKGFAKVKTFPGGQNETDGMETLLQIFVYLAY